VLQVIQHYIRAVDDYERACTEYHRTQQENAMFPQRAGPALPMPQPPRPPHVFVTGSAGSGKSFLIRAIVGVVHRYARQRANERPCPTGGTLLMAPTGMAAFNIGGCTIHSALSIKPEKRGHANFAALSKQLLEPLQQHLRNLLCAIVDEVSMLSTRLMAQMNQRLNQIFHTDGFGSDSIFGNKAVIFCGDLAQLRPSFVSIVFLANVSAPDSPTTGRIRTVDGASAICRLERQRHWNSAQPIDGRTQS